MFKGKNDGRYRVEFKFTNNTVCWLVNDDLDRANGYFNLFTKTADKDWLNSILEITMFDNNVVVAHWNKPSVLAAAA